MTGYTHTCPRCQRSTASPFATRGVCLRCAGERVLAASDPFFEIPAFDVPTSENPDSAVAAEPPRVLPGRVPNRIGPYEIIEELGHGGMGWIFAARQIELGRIVALKVLPTDGNLAGLDLRFLREAQTVARLRHPNIVAVYDSGRANGFVYFSMEYLPDGDVGRLIRERVFNPPDAAALMAKVALAVAAAHREGVLHRDIKPSNILLSGGEPKLADFGLAAELEPGGDLTTVSGVLGTPHYLAPEALHGGSAALTVASDVYALGTVLFECLTGRTPYAGASPATLPSLIATTEPPSPRLLAPAVPRDLETICLTCLERNPARRYRTADALAADLRRFLAGEPIEARPPSQADRFIKFAARHRAAVTAGAVLGAVLVAASIVSTTLALRARRAERTAAAEAATATALADFLKNDLLAQADPDAQPDRNVTLHTVLDRAAKRLDGRFHAQPLVKADLHGVLGEVYDSLGDYDAARANTEAAVRLRRAQLGEAHPQTLAAMYDLAGQLFDSGKVAEAIALARRTYLLQRHVLGADNTQAIATAFMLATMMREDGQIVAADHIQTDALARARRVLPATDQNLIDAVRSLGAIKLREYHLAEAEPLLREAARRQADLTGPESVRALTAQHDLAELLREQGKLREAATLAEHVLEVRRRVLGPEHPHTLGSYNNLANLYRTMKEYDRAAAMQQAGLEIGRRTLGPDHPRVLTMLSNLAGTYRAQGEYALAAAALEETLERTRRINGDGHPTTVRTLAALGEMKIETGASAEAEALLRQAITATRPDAVPGWKLEAWQSLLAVALLRQGRTAEAEPLVLHAYDFFRTSARQPSPAWAEASRQVAVAAAEFYTRTGRLEEAARARTLAAGNAAP